jgi:hypothetical protein
VTADEAGAVTAGTAESDEHVTVTCCTSEGTNPPSDDVAMVTEVPPPPVAVICETLVPPRLPPKVTV